MLNVVITTIQEPTTSVQSLVGKLNEIGGKLIVVGDRKGPERYDNPETGLWPVRFLSLADQEKTEFSLARILPVGHYTRKNLAYLQAIAEGAECVYETDDDNAPNEGWRQRSLVVTDYRLLKGNEDRWVNVYRYFSDENIWPRGLPLDEIQKPLPEIGEMDTPRPAPVQQGLVNGSPDVDAIWRLTMDRPFVFEKQRSVYLEPGNWCPFNTQSTWWWRQAFPLMYIPSHCSFRMCDIWKSFVAQRCLWEAGLGIVFHPAEVDQERNQHDLNRDFNDEIPGYTKNRQICTLLAELDLRKGDCTTGENLLTCYEGLVRAGIFPEVELTLVKAWLNDMSDLAVS